MNLNILKPEIRDFVNKHIGVDVSGLALTKNPFPHIDWHLILNQIAAKSKAKEKFPEWYSNDSIFYPGKISIEQSSSEATAKYKAGLVAGKMLIDMTGGMGIDDYFFSKTVAAVVHCETDSALSEIAAHNFKHLGAKNITCIAGDSLQTLKDLKHNFDWMYIDPSRRNDKKGKVFMLADCLPNVPAHLATFFSKTDNILLKTAPLLDISAGLSELQFVKEIHIVAVKNEVKELLWLLSKGYTDKVRILAVNLTDGQPDAFEYKLGDNVVAHFGTPKKYLYEPNAAIMKSGGFNAVSAFFCIEKLHKHSHLYTSDKIIDFPGRTFQIDQQISYTKSGMHEIANIDKANISVRNFPDSVENIRKQHKIAEGGSLYCFFTTDVNDNKIVLICTKLK